MGYYWAASIAKEEATDVRQSQVVESFANNSSYEEEQQLYSSDCGFVIIAVTNLALLDSPIIQVTTTVTMELFAAIVGAVVVVAIDCYKGPLLEKEGSYFVLSLYFVANSCCCCSY